MCLLRAHRILMSLITRVPVGSKTKTLALSPFIGSYGRDEFWVVSGSWDDAPNNKIRLNSILTDLSAFDDLPSLAGVHFQSKEIGTIALGADHLNDVRFIDSHKLVGGLASGALSLIDLKEMSLRPLATHPSGAACKSLDVGNGKIATCYEDGSVALHDYSGSSLCSSIKLQNGAVPLDVCWIDDSLFAVATNSSKVLLYDSKSLKLVNSFNFISSRTDPQRYLRINTIDRYLNQSGVPLLYSGDSEGGLCCWDPRNASRPLLQTVDQNRKSITCVKTHPVKHNSVVSCAIDGSIVEHSYNGTDLVESWRMADSNAVPIMASCLDMVGGLAVAGLTNANLVTWRM